MVSREVNAVNQEHEKNRNDMTRRMWELLRGRGADPANPLSHFFTGNKETLLDAPAKHNVSAVAELKKFYAKHYCAGNMFAVIVANRGLDELEASAQKHFSTIPNRDGCSSGSSAVVPGGRRGTTDGEKEGEGVVAAFLSAIGGGRARGGRGGTEGTSTSVATTNKKASATPSPSYPPAFPPQRLAHLFTTPSTASRAQLWTMFPVHLPKNHYRYERKILDWRFFDKVAFRKTLKEPVIGVTTVR